MPLGKWHREGNEKLVNGKTQGLHMGTSGELMVLGFTKDQIAEIEEGKKAGLNTSVYEKVEYLAIQMRQIRLGLMDGLNVTYYANPEYDWFQMEEIRLGLKAGLNVSCYASVTISYEKMRQLREGLMEDINLSGYIGLEAGVLKELRKSLKSKVQIIEYIRAGYDKDQLYQIRVALEKGIDIKPYLSKEFRAPSISEIARGLEKGLNVSFYAKTEYDWRQMREIRLGMEHRADFYKYRNPMFSWKQMREIRIGLENGVNVKLYASLMFPHNEMRRKRLVLLQSAYAAESGTLQQEQIGQEETKGILVNVSSQDMEAYIQVLQEEEFTRNDIIHALESRGVVKGYLHQEIDNMVEGQFRGQSILVAVGQEATVGEDGYYEFFFATDMDKKPKIMPDGSVDYKSVKWFEMVKAEQKIAYYHEATEGKEGYTVMGRVLPTRRGKEKGILVGKGFTIDDDKRTYYAGISGRVDQDGNHIEITPVLEIGEVNPYLGDIVFDGTVEIRGNVLAGGVIRASQDVVVDGFIESAVIECGGSAFLRHGVNGAGKGMVKAQGKVVGKFFEATRIYAGEGVEVNYCMNCNIETPGMLVLSETSGSLVGGNILARRGVIAHNIGNHVGVKTYIKMGVDDEFQKKLLKLEWKMADVQKEINILQNAYKEFQIKYPPEVRNSMEVYLKLESAIYTKEKEREELLQEKNDLMAEFRELNEAKAVILGTLYEGTIFEICGLHWNAPTIQNTMVKRTEEGISMFAN